MSVFVHTFASVHTHNTIHICTYVYSMLMFMSVSLFALGVSRNCMHTLWVLQFYMFNIMTIILTCEVLVFNSIFW